MKQNLTILLLTIIISGCISYNKIDFEFTGRELRHLSNYHNGDTIYFQSNLGDVDTIQIHEIVSERIETHGGFIAQKPSNAKWIEIKHLPIDNWHGTSQDMTTGGKVKIVYQSLFSIHKYPTDKKTEYCISFRNFVSGFDTIIGEIHQDTLILNDLKISNYLVLPRI
jgi:hypothetical protein